MKRTLLFVSFLSVVLLAVPLLLSSCFGSGNENPAPTATSGVTTTTGVVPTTAITPTTAAVSTTEPAPTTTGTEGTGSPATSESGESTTTVTVSFEGASVFTAELSGTEVVPAVETQATGSAVFKIDPTGTRGYFKLTLSNINDVIASRLHEGKPGSNGQGLLILYPGPTLTGPFTGVISQTYFGTSALIGSLRGKTLADFAALLQSGNAYVNVGTVKNPGGEIRGQVREETSTSDGQNE
jgi:hypothetical protein